MHRTIATNPVHSEVASWLQFLVFAFVINLLLRHVEPTSAENHEFKYANAIETLHSNRGKCTTFLINTDRHTPPIPHMATWATAAHCCKNTTTMTINGMAAQVIQYSLPEDWCLVATPLVGGRTGLTVNQGQINDVDASSQLEILTSKGSIPISFQYPPLRLSSISHDTQFQFYLNGVSCTKGQSGSPLMMGSLVIGLLSASSIQSNFVLIASARYSKWVENTAAGNITEAPLLVRLGPSSYTESYRNWSASNDFQYSDQIQINYYNGRRYEFISWSRHKKGKERVIPVSGDANDLNVIKKKWDLISPQKSPTEQPKNPSSSTSRLVRFYKRRTNFGSKEK